MKVLPKNLCEWTEENTTKPQDGWCHGFGLNKISE